MSGFFISNLGGNADILRPINIGRSFFYLKNYKKLKSMKLEKGIF